MQAGLERWGEGQTISSAEPAVGLDLYPELMT